MSRQRSDDRMNVTLPDDIRLWDLLDGRSQSSRALSFLMAQTSPFSLLSFLFLSLTFTLNPNIESRSRMANMEESRQPASHSNSSDPEPFFPHPPPPAQSSQETDSQSNNKRKKTSSSSSSSTSTSSKVKGGKATIKPHICPTCSSTFSRLFNLNQHVLIHTNNREFNCLEDGCSKVFLRSTDLTRHCKHVHRVDTKKDKRYSIQKKKLSDKNKQQTSSASTSYQPPPSPSASSSASSEHTNSTGASSYSTYSNSALERDSAFNKLAQEPLALLQRKPLPGDQSDNESMELDMRDDYSDRIRPTYDSR